MEKLNSGLDTWKKWAHLDKSENRSEKNTFQISAEIKNRKSQRKCKLRIII